MPFSSLDKGAHREPQQEFSIFQLVTWLRGHGLRLFLPTHPHHREECGSVSERPEEGHQDPAVMGAEENQEVSCSLSLPNLSPALGALVSTMGVPYPTKLSAGPGISTHGPGWAR